MQTAPASRPLFGTAHEQRTPPRHQLNQASVAIAAQILLGLIFLLAGMSGLLIIHNPPAVPPGLGTILQDVLFRPFWSALIEAIEELAGARLRRIASACSRG